MGVVIVLIVGAVVLLLVVGVVVELSQRGSEDPAQRSSAAAQLDRRQFRGDLSGKDLRGTDLHDADLSGVNLAGVQLDGADLTGANLRGANLADARIYRAFLAGADLTGADLTHANLSGAHFDGAILRTANLHRALTISSGVCFDGADLSDANVTGVTLMASIDGADLSGADLTDANVETSGTVGLHSVWWSDATRWPLAPRQRPHVVMASAGVATAHSIARGGRHILNPHGGVAAAKSLAGLIDRGAVDELLEAMVSEDGAIALAAIDALRYLHDNGHPIPAEPIRDALEHFDWENLVVDDEPGAWWRWRDIAHSILGQPAVRHAPRTLNGTEILAARESLSDLGLSEDEQTRAMLGDRRAAAPLIRLLPDARSWETIRDERGHDTLRCWAVLWALGNIQAGEAVPVLCAELDKVELWLADRYRNPGVSGAQIRKATAIADTLARLRDPRALSALQRFDRPDITEETVDNANNVYGVAGAGWAFQAYLDVHRAIVSLQIRQKLAAL